MKRQFGSMSDVILFLDIISENTPFNHILKYTLNDVYGRLTLNYRYQPIPKNWTNYTI